MAFQGLSGSGSGDIGDLASLIALGNGSYVPAGPPPSHVNNSNSSNIVLHDSGDIPLPTVRAVVERSELDMLIAFGQPTSVSLPKSRALCASHAREQRAIIRSQKDKQTSESARRNLRSILRHVTANFLVIARIFGMVPRFSELTEEARIIKMTLAVAPKLRGQYIRCDAQNRAVAIFSLAISNVQAERNENVFRVSVRDNVEMPTLAGALHRMHHEHLPTIEWQQEPRRQFCVSKFLTLTWDESEQKLKAFRELLSTLRQSEGSTVSQVMVSAGSFGAYRYDTSDDTLSCTSDTLLLKARRLQHGTADFILESFARGVPFVFDNIDPYVSGVVAGEEMVTFWFFLGCDRASVNYVVAEVLFSVVLSSPTPCVVPHLEFCGIHALCLARARPKNTKNM